MWLAPQATFKMAEYSSMVCCSAEMYVRGDDVTCTPSGWELYEMLCFYSTWLDLRECSLSKRQALGVQEMKCGICFYNRKLSTSMCVATAHCGTPAGNSVTTHGLLLRATQLKSPSR